jgi:hypothetical protein
MDPATKPDRRQATTRHPAEEGTLRRGFRQVGRSITSAVPRKAGRRDKAGGHREPGKPMFHRRSDGERDASYGQPDLAGDPLSAGASGLIGRVRGQPTIKELL